MKKIRVLIADDNNIMSENIRRIISGIEEIEIVGIASNGEEEYNYIKQQNPDFLFSDVKMPKMTGIEVLEKLNNEKFKNIPTTVFVTGENINVFNNRAIMGYVYDIIMKPYNNDRILSVMQNYIKEIKRYERLNA